jgi:hypothetical protein
MIAEVAPCAASGTRPVPASTNFQPGFGSPRGPRSRRFNEAYTPQREVALAGNRRAVLIRGEKRDNKSQQAEATGP